MAPRYDELTDRDKGVVHMFLSKVDDKGASFACENFPPAFFDDSELVALSSAAAAAYCFGARGDSGVDDSDAWTENRRLLDVALIHDVARATISSRLGARGVEFSDADIERLAADYNLPAVPVQGRLNDGGVTIYPCRGCPQITIYGPHRLCSDCQVDVECGRAPGTFYREEQAEQARWEAEQAGRAAEPSGGG
jgi:hypothetical protein